MNKEEKYSASGEEFVLPKDSGSVNQAEAKEEMPLNDETENISSDTTDLNQPTAPCEPDVTADEEPYEKTAEDDAELLDSDTLGQPSEESDGIEENIMSAPSLPPAEAEEPLKGVPDNGEKTFSKKKILSSAFDFIELFVFTLVSVLIVTSFFFRHSVVDGPSMEGTLHDGQTLIISDFMYEPKAGDIVVCQDYTMNEKLQTTIDYPIVKRIIATEGQTVYITKTDVYIDCVPFEEGSVPLDEPYVYGDPYYFLNTPLAMEKHITENGVYYQLTVGEGEVFVMGDNRNNSTDSRVLGTISEDAILGRVLIRIYPFSDFGRVN